MTTGTRNVLVVLVVCSLAALPAEAQFANNQLGLSFGYANLSSNNLTYALPLTLMGGVHLEDAFELTASFALAYVRLPVRRAPDGLLIVPTLGFRYLFLQETIRPYVGVDLSYLHLFSFGGALAFNDYVGLGPKVGVEFFTSDSFSLGVQAEAGFYFSPLQPLATRLQIAATANVYF